MSGGYASRLSEYKNKGICDLPEIIQTGRTLEKKLTTFADLVSSSKYITILTGAGISTSAGIPDFRGPKGIWTIEGKEKRGKKRSTKRQIESKESLPYAKRTRYENIAHVENATLIGKAQSESNSNPSQGSFENAEPTFTHKAITKLVDYGKVQYVITQNVDGLHRRSGLPRSKHSVLHGCVFTEKCELCHKEYFRDFDVLGVSFQKTGRKCTVENCGGDLRDTVLDWEDELPDPDFTDANKNCERSDLVICLGTSLRIEPAGSMPSLAKQFVIVNLQKTPYDSNAKLIIRARVDDVMSDLLSKLDVIL